MLTVLIVNVLTVPKMVSVRLVTYKSTGSVFNDYTIFLNKTMTSNIKDKKYSKQAMQVKRVVDTMIWGTLVINLILDFTVHLKTTGRKYNRKRSIKF